MAFMDGFGPGDRQQRGFGLLERFEIFGLRNGVEHDSGSSLNVRGAIPKNDRPDDGPGVDVAVCPEPSDSAAVGSATFWLKFGDQPGRTYFRCPRESADRKAGLECVDPVFSFCKPSLK